MRHCKSQLLSGFVVDDQFELRGCLHRQVSRLSPFKNAINIGGRTFEQVVNIDPIGDQTTPLYHETIRIDGRYTVTRCGTDDNLVMSRGKNVWEQNHTSIGLTREANKSCLDVLVVVNYRHESFELKG